MSSGFQPEDEGVGVAGYGSDGGMFQKLCGNVTTALLAHHSMLQELLLLKDELLTYHLPSNLLLTLTMAVSRVYRSYGDLCSPVGELSRLALQHCESWEKNSEGLRKIRRDYDSMKRRMNITLQMMQGLSAQEEQRLHERRLGHWERLYCHVMQSKSHGRRWKFRIEPLRRKIASGWNPFQESGSSSSESESEKQDEAESKDGDAVEPFRSASSKTTVERASAISHFSEALSEESSTPLSVKSVFTPVHLVDTSIGTTDPSYDNFLLVQLLRPTGIADNVNIFCTVTLGDKFYTSEAFPVVPPDPDVPSHQSFHFPLSEEAVKCLPPSDQSQSSCRLVVGVYPRNVSQSLVATLSLPLSDIQLTEEPTVIVPPQCREEEFEVDWQKLSAAVSGAPSSEYLLTLQKEKEEVDYEVEDPLLHMTCHRIRVQRHQVMHCGTDTMEWDSLMSALGYTAVPETQSRAISALTLDYFQTPMPTEQADMGPTRSEVRVQLEKDIEEALTSLKDEHQMEVNKMEDLYEDKIQTLTLTLTQVKAEKSKQIAELEETLVEMERLMGKGRRSLADVKTMVERRRTTVNMGLPQWGKDLPEDFLDRLDIFNEERSRKKEELTDKIKREVSRICEEQLAVQHRLDPGRNFSLEYDLSLPAIFLPSSKNLVFSPRARQFFHPTGSNKKRLTQPPAVFKLPPLQLGQSTQHMVQPAERRIPTEPLSSIAHQSLSPLTTPAPPPSSCGNYEVNHPHPHPSSSNTRLSVRPHTTISVPLGSSSSSPPLLPRRRHSAHQSVREEREGLELHAHFEGTKES